MLYSMGIKIATIAPAVLLLSLDLKAATKFFEPELEVSIAAVRENSLVLEDTDQINRSGDTGSNMALSLGFNSELSEDSDLSISYALNSTDYQTSDDFDLRTQIFHGHSVYRFTKINFTLRGYLATSALDDTDYLEMSSASPEIGIALSKRLYFHGHYRVATKTFHQDSFRNSESRYIGGHLYVLIDNLDHYISMLYRSRSEDALADQYDNTADEVGLTWVTRYSVINTPLKLSMSITHRDQQFTLRNSVDGHRRNDRMFDASTDLTLDISEHLFLSASYRYLINRSTIDDVDYIQHRAEVRLGVRL